MKTPHHSTNRILSVAACVTLLSGGASFAAAAQPDPEKTAAARQYTGDGTLTDRGPKASYNRYRVDLGDIDLTKSGKHEFTLSGLPAGRFTTSIALDLPHPFNDPKRPNDEKPDWFKDVTVKMTLTEQAKAATVFSFGMPLHQYTWTNVGPAPNWSELYQRGDFRPERERSFFTAKQGSTYTLVVEVTSETATAADAVLLVQGGGSKVN